jgi:hypothetical protein
MDNLRSATPPLTPVADCHRRDQTASATATPRGWFTEGFDTLDLKEAKTLLGALAS